MGYDTVIAMNRPSDQSSNARGLRIVIISDGTGETASLMTKAAMVQFGDKDIFFTRYKNIRTRAQVEAIYSDAVTRCDLVVYTIVSPEIRELIEDSGHKADVPVIDLLGPILNAMSVFFSEQPREQPGLFHQVNDRYFRRIGAMEYTIKHDDGKDLQNLDKADIIILGISRTSKTPLSMFLSHQGWRVCNIPLVKGIPVPKEIFEVDQNKIIGLTIHADVLHEIRKARLGRLGKDPSKATNNEDYASLESVSDDIEYANTIFRQNKKWPIFDVSGKALEETSTEILKLIRARKMIASRKADAQKDK